MEKLLNILILLFVVVNKFHSVPASSLPRLQGLSNSRRPAIRYNSVASTMANNFCTFYGLQSGQNGYSSARRAFLKYAVVSSNSPVLERVGHLYWYTKHCSNARITPEECADAIYFLRQKGYNLSSAVRLLKGLNNNRHFLAERKYLQLNMIEAVFLEYDEIPFLNMAKCFNRFGELTRNVSLHSLVLYKDVYSQTSVIVGNLELGNEFCRCNETVKYYMLFVIEFGVSEAEMRELYGVLCFVTNKISHWRADQLSLFLATVRNDRTRYSWEVYRDFLIHGWRLSLSSWGSYTVNWNLLFIMSQMPSDRTKYQQELTAMSYAMDNGFSEQDYEQLLIHSNHPELGYNASRCRYELMKTSLTGQLDDIFLGHQIKVRNIWDRNTRSDLVTHIINVVRYAVSKNINCRVLVNYLEILEDAVDLNDWSPITAKNLIMIAENSPTTEFARAITCIKLLADIEYSSALRDDPAVMLTEAMASVEVNFERLLYLDKNVMTCTNFQKWTKEVIDGPTLLMQSILNSKNFIFNIRR